MRGPFVHVFCWSWANIIDDISAKTGLTFTEVGYRNAPQHPDMIHSELLPSGVDKNIFKTLGDKMMTEDQYDYKNRLREVDLGNRDGEWVSVVNGIALDETIVADGAFHLNNERKKKELE
jgi:hypothetical protein